MLENLNLNEPKRPCKVRRFYETLSESDQEILMSNLCNTNIPSKRLERALKEVSVDLGDRRIINQRSGNCSCSKI
mgnify:CR=1 FL=1